MRQALGTAVFSGMLGVILYGLFLTPVFCVAVRRVALGASRRRPVKRSEPAGPQPSLAESTKRRGAS
jgi:hydrophobic/amphiphilic exporter-1 (mainly G- bacteria), HAE1 family